jgi:hypothetical protein
LVTYDKGLVKYLSSVYPSVRIEKAEGKSWYRFVQSRTELYIIGSKVHPSGKTWSDLGLKEYERIRKNPTCFCALPYGDQYNRTVVLPADKILTIFDNDFLSPKKNGPVWQFGIVQGSGGHYLEFNKKSIGSKSNANPVQDYLNDWDQIPDIAAVEAKPLSGWEFERAMKNGNNKEVEKVLVYEKMANAKRRGGQDVIRRKTLSAYTNQCAVCVVNDSDLLVASHVVPWSLDVAKRGVLKNVICLCTLHDRLFETGRFVIDGQNNYEIKFSDGFKALAARNQTYHAHMKLTAGNMRRPSSNAPDSELLDRHRKRFGSNTY